MGENPAAEHRDRRLPGDSMGITDIRVYGEACSFVFGGQSLHDSLLEARRAHLTSVDRTTHPSAKDDSENPAKDIQGPRRLSWP